MGETRSPETRPAAGTPPPVPGPRPSPETGRRQRRLTGAVLFYSVLAAVLGAYTLLAFDMEWSTQAGRIGPGFFPRTIGVAGVALSLVGLVTSLRSTPAAETDGTESGHHPALVAVIGVALAGFVTVFIPVGAPLTAAAFLLLMYFLIDRKYIVRRIILSLAFPLFLYLFFEVWLNAGLPAGLTAFL
ncbi:tripartite tricarboxylate transporter TctB family protein [Allosalinactinospora lopnorensis]|uniref:tripartite tricarboxylate transporter TctB family protein n=1 Tax=Allosalinactinospora lopnorensis TaxID=1352348 RepID=UPI000623C1E9|nr:tripartite tricarboxylate transporter TctB family protein [Allosalinactinospora lopnorensis]